MKDKKHKKKDKPFMKTHSRRTGKIILVALTLILIGGISFFALAWNEADKINQDEKRFRALSCEEMNNEINEDYPNIEEWKLQARYDKRTSGNCEI